jgi:hypothetical protein
MEGTVKMTKIQITVIIAVCVLLAVFILRLNAPSAPGTAVAPVEQKSEEPQVGKYELPTAQEDPAYPEAQATAPQTAPVAGNFTEKNAGNTLTAEPEKPQTYEPDPSLPKKPPKLPPPEQLREMQRRGIVAY